MEHFLVTKASVNYALDQATGDIAGAWDIDNLEDGALAIFDMDGSLVDDAAPAVTGDWISIAVGRYGSDNKLNIINGIDRATLSYQKQAYEAPVAKVLYIGDDNDAATYSLNLPNPLVPGTSAIIRFINRELPEYDTTRESVVEYVIQDGDTEADVQDGLVAAFNAHAIAGALATAAESSTTANLLGISITANTAGKDFTVVCEGILEDADILEYQYVNKVYNAAYTYATAHNKGHGTSAQVKQVESDFSPHKGNINSNYLGNQLYTESSNVVTGETYTTYTLTWRHPRNSEFPSDQSVKQRLVIAIPHDETGAGKAITAMDTILDSL